VLVASVVAFMGIGLVDPILPVIGKGLHASPSQIELLFTSYFLIIGVSNLLAGFVSSRIGNKRTMLLGLLCVVVFSACAGASNTVAQVVGFRAGWGLGIALFVSTSMSVIIGSAVGGPAAAVVLFESALGIGIASGPLVGGLLGGVSWRAPFFGVAVLMAISFVMVATFVPFRRPTGPKQRLSEPLRALGHRGLLVASIVALLYNFGFFTLLAYTPLPLDLGVHALGLVFFCWGVLLALSAVFIAPKLNRRFGVISLLAVTLVVMAADLLVIGIGVHNHAIIIPAIIFAGLPLGIGNSALSNLLLGVSETDAAVAASATNFIRFCGGAIAPFLAGKLSEHVSLSAPLYVAAGAVTLGLMVLLLGRPVLELAHENAAPMTVAEREEAFDEAFAGGVGV